MSMTKCLCQSFSFGSYGPDGSAESFTDYTTDCTQTTTRTFAQGHDAKLVGYLVRAEMAGEEIATVEGGLRITFGDAIKAAKSISDALAAKTEAQLDAARARLAKKAEMEASKKAKRSARKADKAEAAPALVATRIRVGRWEYDAMIDGEGKATYTSSKGEVTSREAGQYKVV